MNGAFKRWYTYAYRALSASFDAHPLVLNVHFFTGLQIRSVVPLSGR
jgi:hypothetical protein